MKTLVLLLMSLLSFSLSFAQEVQSTSLDFKHGTLTFEFYEKDGVKIPNGNMEYTATKKPPFSGIEYFYSEKGITKNGYKDGLWTISIKEGSFRDIVIRMNYKDGLLDGKTTIEDSRGNHDRKTDKYSPSKEEYTFKNGRLFGENITKTHSGTFYINYDENGERTGVWKVIERDETYLLDYDNADIRESFSGKITKFPIIYHIDILGEKTISNHDPYISVLFAINQIKAKLEEEFWIFQGGKRDKLPTKSPSVEAPYGLFGNK